MDRRLEKLEETVDLEVVRVRLVDLVDHYLAVVDWIGSSEGLVSEDLLQAVHQVMQVVVVDLAV